MKSNRIQFIQHLFQELKNKPYLLLKFTENSLSELDEHTDLDLLLDTKYHKQIHTFVKNHTAVQYVKVLNQTNLYQLFIHFKDGGFLQIDCLPQLIRKHTVYLPNEYLNTRAIKKDGVKTYNNYCLFEHLVLYNQLNFSGLKPKYINWLEQLPAQELNTIIASFNNKYKTDIQNVSSLAEYQEPIQNYINNKSFNSFSTKFKNSISYIKDSIYQLRHARGFLVSFSGVDGAGKSTILEETRALLSEKFRKKTIVIRHRPSLLPILSSYKYGKENAEKRSAATLPRQGNNKSKLSSMIRFAYYYMDYIVGRSYIFFRYQMRNYIVLYDRYYFDFIIDGKRSNLNLDKGLPKWLYRFVQKPDYNFFLYASADIILSRKKELTSEAIEDLTAGYQDLFDEFTQRYSQQYIAINNIDKQTTLDRIQQELQSSL